MNVSTQQTINIVIDCLIMISSAFTISLSTGAFIFILYHVIKTKTSPNRIALLLTANMYLALLFCGIMCLIQYSHALPGHIYLLISLNDGIYCRIRTYFVLVSVCSVYYSNSLQSIYRLNRVAFYTKQSFQSFQLYIRLIVIQWIVCFLLMIPSLLIGDFIYIETDYYCQIDFRDLRNVFVNTSLIYFISIGTTFGCYFYTMKKMHVSNNNLIQRMTRIQQMIARRDVIVLSRICILVGLLISASFAGGLGLLIYIITGYLPWWSTQLQWFIFSGACTSVSIVLTLVFPHVRNLLKKHLLSQRNTTNGPAIVRLN